MNAQYGWSFGLGHSQFGRLLMHASVVSTKIRQDAECSTFGSQRIEMDIEDVSLQVTRLSLDSLIMCLSSSINRSPSENNVVASVTRRVKLPPTRIRLSERGRRSEDFSELEFRLIYIRSERERETRDNFIRWEQKKASEILSRWRAFLAVIHLARQRIAVTCEDERGAYCYPQCYSITKYNGINVVASCARKERRQRKQNLYSGGGSDYNYQTKTDQFSRDMQLWIRPIEPDKSQDLELFRVTDSAQCIRAPESADKAKHTSSPWSSITKCTYPEKIGKIYLCLVEIR